MTVINTNMNAQLTANSLMKNERAMTQTMERLSTGLRINSAADETVQAPDEANASSLISMVGGDDRVQQQLVRDDAGGALRLLYEQQAHEAHDGAAQGAGAAPEQRVHRVPHAVVLQREGEG